MGITNDTGAKLIADVVYLTQRASSQTCSIAARTIERQTSRFLAKYPEEIKNAYAFELTSHKLCECLQSLEHVASGTGNEILVKRQALDLLLALSNEVEYMQEEKRSYNNDLTPNLARVG